MLLKTGWSDDHQWAQPLRDKRNQIVLLDDMQIGLCACRTDRMPTIGKAVLNVMIDIIEHRIDF
jgi:hypothetical protein